MNKSLLCLYLFLLPVITLAQESAILNPPNIVFVLADDMGYGDLSSYNPSSKIQTPNIDRLAKEGVRFTDAHSGGSSCTPSRYALMTGRFAVRQSMSLVNGPLIEKDRMTVASMLREQGYATVMVGKWHLGFDPYLQDKETPADYSLPLRGGPVDCGFESFFGMHSSLDLPPYFHMRDRAPIMPPTDNVSANSSLNGPEGWSRTQGAFWRAGKIAPDFKFEQVTPRFAQEAVSVIRSHASTTQDKPLFLYLALPSPHTPWLPKEKFRGKSGAGMYGDFVLQVDAVVEQILDALKATGMEQNTMVIFSSDNGPLWFDKDRERFGHDSAGGLRGKKFDSWEGGHRMPFLVRWPRIVSANRVCEQTIVFSDVLATFAELVDLKQIPHGMAEDSVSFLPYLFDDNKKPEKRPPIIHDKWTVRNGAWKLILPKQKEKNKANVTAELYNLQNDLSEKTNLFSQHPEIVKRIINQYQLFMSGK